MPVEQAYIRTPEAAKYLGLSVSLLEKLRVRGTGPRFSRVPGGAAILYAKADLDAWVAAGARLSTSEAA
jgi:predicted DNA-binding transcriptional regulator AlpA